MGGGGGTILSFCSSAKTICSLLTAQIGQECCLVIKNATTCFPISHAEVTMIAEISAASCSYAYRYGEC